MSEQHSISLLSKKIEKNKIKKKEIKNKIKILEEKLNRLIVEDSIQKEREELYSNLQNNTFIDLLKIITQQKTDVKNEKNNDDHHDPKDQNR